MSEAFLRHLEDPPADVGDVVAAYQCKVELLLLEVARLSGDVEWRRARSLPAAWLHLFRKALDLYDESTRFFLGYLRRCGYSVACQQGCSHCCRQMPSGVSIAELLYLYQGMWERAGVSRWVRRCLERQELWGQLCGTPHGDGVGPVPASAEPDRDDLLLDYQMLRQDCPLLENQHCQVYDHRPLACRMHFSLSAPHWCDPGHFQNEYAVRFNLEVGERVQTALRMVGERLRLSCSDLLTCGLLELTVNVFRFEPMRWLD